MVYIFFLFDAVKPPVNSPGWFTCFKNNVQHTALIGDKRLPETLFFLSVCVKETNFCLFSLIPLSLPVSVSDTLFGFVPNYQSAVSPDFLLVALVLKTGCRLGDVCMYVYFFFLQYYHSSKPYEPQHCTGVPQIRTQMQR